MYWGLSLWLVLFLLATTLADSSKVAWGDWLIVDENDPGAGTSILLRRITPKSVFVAPTFNGCSEGYKQDALGRCVKLVQVTKQAQWNFFLERLNSMYAPSSTSKNPQKEAGPFHISLPIGSQGSQEEIIIKKRVPPKIVETKTIRPPPLSTTLPPTTMTTMTEVTLPTFAETPEVTSTENFSTTDNTAEGKLSTESIFDPDVMLGDQPVSTEDTSGTEILETPKNQKENLTLPFVIIVTNEPTTRPEETTVPSTSVTPLTTEREDTIAEIASTTEGTTETSSFTTEATTLRTTKYEEGFSETRDVYESSLRPTVISRLSTTVRPKCTESSKLRDDLIDFSDCEPETSTISDEKEVTDSTLPTSLPLLEPNTHVRFPSESYVPVRKIQSYVRFPDVPRPQEDRPRIWWPSWQVQRYPGIQGWPSSEDRSPEHRKPEEQRPYPPYSQGVTSWADSTSWRRRFLQRD
ncbi:uncharacterized protein LOC124354049 [Homalodisca vitripennis]|uniref:uncharacterized protein LOC124354049 n=1 Tax=Homalodisca vitripennis TaxID=197043 RepID=UPI001EEC951F|nr:uncharacterized protein LOC124354049 [Homalodisca vitripennis]XP_046660174.1 uncharacterized protein LOC124354049 [Homalodisca vitripennis]